MSAGRAPRTHRAIAWTRAGQLPNLAGWTAMWDRDTNVPLRLWGDGVIVSGSVADPAIAEAAARQFLAQHISTLAPGSQASDFELVSNVVGAGGVRSVGFVQRSNGVRVLGGSIGFGFKADRLAMVSSTALPNVNASIPSQRLASSAIQRAATRWLADAGQAVNVVAAQNALASERVIIPVVRPRIGASPSITYRVAEQVDVQSSTGPGRWNVWIDAADASPIARKSTLMYLSGKVKFNVGDRRPTGTRSDQPAANGQFTIDGAQAVAALDGTVTWAGAGSATISAKGKFVSVQNAAGTNISQTVTLQSGGVFSFARPTNEQEDAQIDSYIYADQAKRFAKTKLNPTLAYLDQIIVVNVNENDTCNAFSTGDDIHFFQSSAQCENTGRLADVVYHEFGHSLHGNSIIDGVGAFDGALSEGLADTLAEAITGDPGMGRGFFKNDQPLRDLDPVGVEKRFPEDATGEVHDDGEIIGEALWDLRKGLEAKYGAAAGFDAWLPIMYSAFQRAHDIPSTFPEALLANDDDGNLANGTPDQCEIIAAFGLHGLADPTATLGLAPPTRDNFTVSIVAMPPQTACATSTVQSVTLDWKPRGGTGGQVTMAQNADTFAGDIPTQPDGTVVQYQVTVALSDGSSIKYPQNPADPFYEFYVGDVTTIKCFDFETGADDWTKTGDWEAGAPQGLSTDPTVAFAGTGVFGMDLTQDGAYLSRNMSVAESPAIDLMGNTNVRLQYRRWLGVEDGFYDHARIQANGTEVFSNFASPTDPQSGGVNHVDREWQFKDIDLKQVAEQSTDGKIKLQFSLESDEGLEFGGWTLDDVCIVAASGPAVTCGNGAVDDGETCDDGNRTAGDGCDANCQDEDSAGGGGGCCSAGTGATGPIALSLLTLGMVFRRRRRR